MSAPRSLNLLHFLSLDSVGGVERYFTNFLAHRSPTMHASHGVFLISRRIHPFLDVDVRQRAEAVYEWKRCRGLRLPKWPAAVRATYRRRVAKRWAPGIALFWNTLGELEGLQAAKAGGLTTVYWERGLAWHRMRQEDTAAEFLDDVDAVIANSHAGRRILQETRHYEGPIEVCRNALRADARPAHPRPKTLPTDRPLRLGVAARFVSYKGVSLAIHALAELRKRGVDAELRLTGTGPLEEDLRAVAKRLALDEERCRFLGTVSDMPTFYDGLDLLLHPAPCEPCANVIPEAMAHGVPPIAALVDGNPELVLHDHTGLLLPTTVPLADYPTYGGHDSPMPPFVYDPATDTAIEPRLLDPVHLAGAVAELRDDPERYARMSRAAIERVATEFDAARQLDGVLEILAGFAGLAPPAPPAIPAAQAPASAR